MADDRCDLLCLDLETAERIRRERLDVEEAEFAAGRARALADPTRLTLACALAEAEELCVCDLSWIVERSQNLVSHHVRTLRSYGLVRSRREGKMVCTSGSVSGRVAPIWSSGVVRSDTRALLLLENGADECAALVGERVHASGASAG